MVLTKVKFRGRGFAKRLLSEALNLAGQMKIETVKLDATDQGKPLYERLGFRSEQAVERWERPGGRSSNELLDGQKSLAGELLTADQAAFAADRSPLLAKLAERNSPIVTTRSYLFARPGIRTTYLGPCVSEDPQVARSSIENWVRTRTDALSWDLLKQNREAVAIAKGLGFTPQRQLTRMVRGKDLRGREESIYALAGFEFG